MGEEVKIRTDYSKISARFMPLSSNGFRTRDSQFLDTSSTLVRGAKFLSSGRP